MGLRSIGPQAVECGLEHWFEAAGITADGSYGEHHVEDLLEGTIVADLVSALCGRQERSAGG